MQIMVYPPSMQGAGHFDRGKITEQKPIGFSGEGSVIKRIGPLFYWAWAFTPLEGYIPPHPHQAFEIMTYMIAGKAEHGDSLGTRSVIGSGGAQVMQTGSGVEHEERFIGPDAEGFQIWFEPSLREALKRTPTYRQFEHADFPEREEGGVRIKTVIGEGSPITLVAEAKVWDIELQPGASFTHTIAKGHTLSALAVRGGGSCRHPALDAAMRETAFRHKDYLVMRADEAIPVAFTAADDQPVRLLNIEVPAQVDYPLFPKR